MENEKDQTKERLTIVQLRSFPGCEHYTDEEADDISNSLYQLAIILYEATKFKKAGFRHIEVQNKAA